MIDSVLAVFEDYHTYITLGFLAFLFVVGGVMLVSKMFIFAVRILFGR